MTVPGASTNNPISTVAAGGIATVHVYGFRTRLSIMISHCAVSIDVDGETFFLPEPVSQWVFAALVGRNRTMRRF